MKRLVLSEHVRVEGKCHRWTGVHLPNGYGRVGKDLVHRRAYEEAYGSIPPGLQIDHLCETRDCINVEHLRAVTPRENVLRSRTSPSAVNARKTECIHGHEFNEQNTRKNDDGSRTCRPCDASRKRAAYTPKKASGMAPSKAKSNGRRRPTTRPPSKAPRR